MGGGAMGCCFSYPCLLQRSFVFCSYLPWAASTKTLQKQRIYNPDLTAIPWWRNLLKHAEQFKRINKLFFGTSLRSFLQLCLFACYSVAFYLDQSLKHCILSKQYVRYFGLLYLQLLHAFSFAAFSLKYLRSPGKIRNQVSFKVWWQQGSVGRVGG